mmetsp:Transcript_14465/g.39179  ORF Transcript_14465/g.39179 Transcript_14465/m.39179 type:complete len:138 (+) Transcript_14465:227-640(+)
MDQSMISTMRSSLGTGAPYAAPTTCTTTLNANNTPEFKMNNLISREYETTPLQAGHIPGCTVHVPAGTSVVGQRRAQATLHNAELRPLIASTNGQWQDMQLVDLRPQERSYNKNYIYAENAPSNFLKFPKVTDHRRL